MESQGLFDLQVNGYAGVDFNDPSLTAARLDIALEAMLACGVTGCLPTLITASTVQLSERFFALDTAVRESRLGPQMVPGYHLEGPFLNAAEGYCGCHPTSAMVDPDLALVAGLEANLSRPILMITLAPEREGSIEAVRNWASMGKVLAIGHSAAGFECVNAACNAGMTVSTHLGNGLPQVIAKLDNTLLAQLAEPRLTACLIADGVHIPKDALRALISLKGTARSVLVSDAVAAAGMPPGIYPFAGIPTSLHADGRVTQKLGSGLAGSALQLDEAVRNLIDWSIARPDEAIAMAGASPRALLSQALRRAGIVIGPGLISWNDALEPELIERPSLHASKS